jgi:membrane associated rhomboid family serine protease
MSNNDSPDAPDPGSDFRSAEYRYGYSGYGGGYPAPAVNAPKVVVLTVLTLVGIHIGLRLLDPETAQRVTLALAFIPLRFETLPALASQIPGGEIAKVTSFLTYALLHGDWMHLGINCFWMLAFGSVAARRLGAFRFLVLSGLAAAVAASFTLVVSWGIPTILVGASGAIAGQMAVAVRLIFAHGGKLSTAIRRDVSHTPPDSLLGLMKNRSALVFIAIWLGIDMLFASAGVLSGARIAWEAHLGGFLTGLLVFGVLDPHRGRGF